MLEEVLVLPCFDLVLNQARIFEKLVDVVEVDAFELVDPILHVLAER